MKTTFSWRGCPIDGGAARGRRGIVGPRPGPALAHRDATVRRDADLPGDVLARAGAARRHAHLRLGDEVDGAEFQRAASRRRRARSASRPSPPASRSRIRRRGTDAVHARHLHVERDHVGVELRIISRAISGSGGADAPYVGLPVDDLRKQVAHQRRVVDHHDARLAGRPSVLERPSTEQVDRAATGGGHGCAASAVGGQRGGVCGARRLTIASPLAGRKHTCAGGCPSRPADDRDALGLQVVEHERVLRSPTSRLCSCRRRSARRRRPWPPVRAWRRDRASR